MSGSVSQIAKGILSARTTRGQVLRFAMVGGTNTIISTVAFYLLAAVLPARAAFTLAYLAGLTFGVVATPRYVFASSSSWKRRVLLALCYVGTYAVGIGVISVLRSEVSTSRVVVVLGTVMVTAPLSFVGARLLVGRSG